MIIGDLNVKGFIAEPVPRRVPFHLRSALNRSTRSTLDARDTWVRSRPTEVWAANSIPVRMISRALPSRLITSIINIPSTSCNSSNELREENPRSPFFQVALLHNLIVYSCTWGTEKSLHSSSERIYIAMIGNMLTKHPM